MIITNGENYLNLFNTIINASRDIKVHDVPAVLMVASTNNIIKSICDAIGKENISRHITEDESDDIEGDVIEIVRIKGVEIPVVFYTSSDESNYLQMNLIDLSATDKTPGTHMLNQVRALYGHLCIWCINQIQLAKNKEEHASNTAMTQAQAQAQSDGMTVTSYG